MTLSQPVIIEKLFLLALRSDNRSDFGVVYDQILYFVSMSDHLQNKDYMVKLVWKVFRVIGCVEALNEA